MPKTVIVVPCYNEAQRLDREGFRRFLADPSIELLFVNDGSRDETARVLTELCSALGDRATFLDLPRNVGKAEAVRQGMRRGLETGARVTGYFDADLATPPEELIRILGILEERAVDVAIASRVQLLGTRIERTLLRHHLGRVFATLSSLVIRMPVYDTQCGAKLFRAIPALRAALASPFQSRWFFDVELLGRLYHGSPVAPALPLEAFVEVPLACWRDVPGSKIRPGDFPRSLVELLRIRRSLRAWVRGDLAPLVGTPEGVVRSERIETSGTPR